jgi:hypothetical protein
MKICFWTLFHSSIHSHWIPSYCCHTKINSHKKNKHNSAYLKRQHLAACCYCCWTWVFFPWGSTQKLWNKYLPFRESTIEQHPIQGFVCKFSKIASSMEKDYCPAFVAGFDCPHMVQSIMMRTWWEIKHRLSFILLMHVAFKLLCFALQYCTLFFSFPIHDA